METKIISQNEGYTILDQWVTITLNGMTPEIM